MDFSSRWFFDNNGGTNTNLTHIRPQRVVPVDLNTILCKAFSGLSEFYKLLGDNDKQAIWQERSDVWKKSIEMVSFKILLRLISRTMLFQTGTLRRRRRYLV